MTGITSAVLQTDNSNMKLAIIWLMAVVTPTLWALDLSLQPTDLRLDQSSESGYYFFVRKKPDIQSILLTESTKDPAHKNDNFAYRNPQYQSANGDEKQLLNGKFLDKKDRYTLISSTLVDDKQFGKAFRIFIPFVVVYGYPWSRYGEAQILNGMYLSVRAFEKPYGDYDTGSFQDNPFEIAISQKPLDPSPVDANKYMAETVKAFSLLSKDTDGQTFFAKDKTDTVNQIAAAITATNGPELDIVVCVDATQSMEANVPYIRKDLAPMLQNVLKRYKSYRVGMLQFRDYFEDFLYQETPFTTDFSVVQNFIDHVRPFGGGDIPEAVDEALYAAIKDYPWQAKNRLVILVGDAPPHPIPRGSVTHEMVVTAAKENHVKIESIILPQ
jgi:hypothetical protein